jgi:uncharacterized protein YfiM (DUF2279 family)
MLLGLAFNGIHMQKRNRGSRAFSFRSSGLCLSGTVVFLLFRRQQYTSFFYLYQPPDLYHRTAALCCMLLLYFCLPAHSTYIFPAQGSDTVVPAARKWVAAGGVALAFGGSLGLLMQSSNYVYQSRFHVNKTGIDYLGMDKVLHGQVAYTTARLLYGTLGWAGVADKNRTWMASGGALLFMTAKEWLDGHNPRWGWSWSDVGANIAGTAFFGVQQWGWGEQRLQLKFSGVPHRYSDPAIEQQVSMLFGTGLERAVKDYNQQTYWMSANLHSLGWSRLPPWINLAVGHGVENIFGQKENLQQGPGGIPTFDRRDLERRRQWYLSPDIDLTKIPTRSKFLRTAFYVLNTFKMPLPALQLTGGKLKVKAVVF